MLVSASGLVTIIGGKWTTYRKMAEDAVDDALAVGGLEGLPCATESLRIHGWMEREDPDFPEESTLQPYGSDRAALRELESEDPGLAEFLDPRLPYRGSHVVYAARHEMARTCEDALARRTRSLLLDARASIAAAPRTAALLARELGRDAAWCEAEITRYRALAAEYLLPNS